MSFLVIALVLSVLFQTGAALIALHGLRLAGSFRLAWICISIALFLMVGRRLVPLWQVRAWGDLDPLNTYIGLAISLFMLLGVFGLKQLFRQMHDQKDEMEKLAQTDFLTGLNNRRYFMERGGQELIRALRYKSEVSFLMLDIDFFKKVNDTYGHQTGDVVLKEVARHCQKTLRSIDIIGRLGGEEFAIFLPEAACEVAFEVAERLRKGIEQRPMAHVEDKPIYVTVSIGLFSGLHEGDTLEKLLEQADQGLYAAKESGRNRVSKAVSQVGYKPVGSLHLEDES